MRAYKSTGIGSVSSQVLRGKPHSHPGTLRRTRLDSRPAANTHQLPQTRTRSFSDTDHTIGNCCRLCVEQCQPRTRVTTGFGVSTTYPQSGEIAKQANSSQAVYSKLHPIKAASQKRDESVQLLQIAGRNISRTAWRSCNETIKRPVIIFEKLIDLPTSHWRSSVHHIRPCAAPTRSIANRFVDRRAPKARMARR